MNRDNDEIITVTLPRGDYLIMREMIEERQAMRGLKKILQSKVLFISGLLLSIFGVYEALRRFA